MASNETKVANEGSGSDEQSARCLDTSLTNQTSRDNNTSNGSVNVHDPKSEVIDQDPFEISHFDHRCYVCDKVFSANSNLNRHLRKIHKENVQSPYNNVKCALCNSVFASSATYNKHLEQAHEVQIQIEQMTFASKEDFEEWKLKIENDTTSQFIKSRGEKKSSRVNKTYYSCNRSGYYISKSKTSKALKKQGSRKINGRCPASMNVTVNTDLTYDVRFVKTHVGHDFELRHLDLSDKDRELIVQKLTSGLTKKDIIKQIRSGVEQQESNQNVSLSSPASSISNPQNIQNSSVTTQDTNQLNEVCLESATSINQTIETRITPVEDVTNNTSCIELVDTTSAGEIVISNSSSSLSNFTNVILENPHAIHIANQNTGSSGSSLTKQISNRLAARLRLTTTKDIHNIINSKHLDSKLIKHNYDLNNVEAWINEMREYNDDSSVLLYKAQGELNSKFPRLHDDDFVLVLMKTGQAEILKQFGHKCIIIDSTHNVHCEYLHATLVSVIDDDSKGFPIATLFSSRTDLDILDAFFTLIKERVGCIATNMFIADELNDFYQAWSNIMTRPTHNLLSPWSVLDVWTRKFELISNKEKLRRTKKVLRSLLYESDSDKFRNGFKNFIDDNRDDVHTREFISFFEQNYARNPDLWSSCMRKSIGASNYMISQLHDKFKSVYKEGKTSKKLCKYFTCLMRLFDEHQMAKLIQIEEKFPAKRKALVDRHKKSVELNALLYEVAVDPVYWLCPSESSNDSCYEVTKRQTPNDANNEDLRNLKEGLFLSSTTFQETVKCCDLQCVDCAICRHEYKCTCLDYIVNFNMCKHIHRICTMSKQQQ